jgi:hypothetical protein
MLLFHRREQNDRPGRNALATNRILAHQAQREHLAKQELTGHQVRLARQATRASMAQHHQ